MRPSFRPGLLVLASLVVPMLAFAAEPPARVIRVAADPNNLPFSNQRGEGFENRLAEMIAHDLDARLEYLWWAQRRGFFRETVGSGRADVVMGVPAGFERLLTTRPYYRSTYVFVRRAHTPEVTSFDDPSLRRLKVGVQLVGDDGTNTPPAEALSERGIIDNVRGYTLYGDYTEDNPPARIIHAVASNEIDLAIAWGPMAGYFAAREREPLALTPVGPCGCPQLKFVFAIAVGVARTQPDLRREIDAILARRHDDIVRLLADYHVPRADETPSADYHHVAAR